MKKIIYAILIILNFNTYGQKVFEYEFDENISLNILEESEEGKLATGKFVKGKFDNEVLVFTGSDQIKEKLAAGGDKALLELFQGIKNGTLKGSKGKLLTEEIINLQNIKVSKFKISFTLTDKNKILESYSFVYKNNVYTLQFINNEEDFEKLNDFRKNILDSIKFK